MALSDLGPLVFDLEEPIVRPVTRSMIPRLHGGWLAFELSLCQIHYDEQGRFRADGPKLWRKYTANLRGTL